MKKIIKGFIEEITAAAKAGDREAILTVFYKEDGIDMAFQHEKITWNEHQMLLNLINAILANIPEK